MVTKINQTDDFLDGKSTDIVVWGPKFATGIPVIDRQHRELVSLTNELYHACLSGDESVGSVFKDAMSRMVEYVRFHFGAEQELLQKIGYPQHAVHRKMHEDLIQSILEAAEKFNEGRKFVPNHFVRTLKDWIFGHIAIEDKIYAAYVADMIKNGIITAAQLGD